MTRHLLRLVWNRKGKSALIAAEILLAFLVVFGVLLFTVNYANNWRRPLGFTGDRVWTIQLHYERATGRLADPAETERLSRVFRELFAVLRGLPNVEQSSAAFPSVPYLNSNWSTGLGLEDGRNLSAQTDAVTDDFSTVLGIKVIAGRWFSPEDDTASWQPIVVNQRLAREIFGDRDPVNQVIPFSAAYVTQANARTPTRVVGVVDDFRYLGELSMPQNFMFRRVSLNLSKNNYGGSPPNALVIRVTPATTAAFEEILVRSLQAVAPDWSFDVRTMADMRDEHLDSYVQPLLLVGTVAGFLLLMVVLGLTGVVWQSVTRRIQEFGLRRAQGASASDIRWQVMLEMALLTSLSLVPGAALAAQLSLLPFSFNANRNAPPIPGEVFAMSIALSAAVIYVLTLLCSWYPSRLATKIQPADALHFE